jgi:hypothetical protein
LQGYAVSYRRLIGKIKITRVEYLANSNRYGTQRGKKRQNMMVRTRREGSTLSLGGGGGM